MKIFSYGKDAKNVQGVLISGCFCMACERCPCSRAGAELGLEGLQAQLSSRRRHRPLCPSQGEKSLRAVGMLVVPAMWPHPRCFCRVWKDADSSERVLMDMRWGLVPSWFKKDDPSKLQFNTSNCRSDTMLKKSSYKVSCCCLWVQLEENLWSAEPELERLPGGYRCPFACCVGE